jgi:hypothetical protein
MLNTIILSFFFLIHPAQLSLLSVEYSAGSDIFNAFPKLYYGLIFKLKEFEEGIKLTSNITERSFSII